MFSYFGIIALSGVVVSDSLILDDFQAWWKEAVNEVSLGSTRVFSAKIRRIHRE